MTRKESTRLREKERGNVTVGFAFGLTTTLATTGLVAWSIWLHALQIYTQGLANEAAEIGALMLPGSSQSQIDGWIDSIKDDLTDRISAFPGAGVFRPNAGGLRVHIEPAFKNRSVMVHIYVCRNPSGFLFSKTPAGQEERNRDCLGQFIKGHKGPHSNTTSESDQLSGRQWISARSVFPYTNAQTIFQSGLSGLPDKKRRAKIHKRLLSQGLLFKSKSTATLQRLVP
jgi:hypothetical protein